MHFEHRYSTNIANPNAALKNILIDCGKVGDHMASFILTCRLFITLHATP